MIEPKGSNEPERNDGERVVGWGRIEDSDICILRAESADTLREQVEIIKFMLASGELTDAQREQCLRDLQAINERMMAYLS